MHAAAEETVFPHIQRQDFFKESHQQCYLQLLEDEFVSTLHSSIFLNGCQDQETTHEDHHLSFLADPTGSNMLANSITSDYNFGDGEYLFQAQEPIPEEPLLPLDSMTEALSMLSGVEDIISEGTIEEAAETHTLGTEPSLNEIYRELQKDLIGSPAIEESSSELLGMQFPTLKTEDAQRPQKEEGPPAEGPLQKSVSSGCLTSDGGNNGWPPGQDAVGYKMDMGAAFGMRRSYSEGDIKNLSNKMPEVNAMVWPLPLKPCLLTIESFKSEERLQKLFRYRKKKSMRNFGRKIKYACRKALADNQPRVRGRFAKTEEYARMKHQK